MFRNLIILTLLCLPSISLSKAAAADPPLYDLSGLSAGTYKMTVNADGSVTLSPLVIIKPTPGPTPPTPPTPNPNPPPPLTERGKAVMTAALAVQGDPDRAGTAHGLAELYRQTAAIFRSTPTATPAQLTTALSTANNTFLSARNVATVWQPVRDVIGTYWTPLTVKAGVTPADFALLLEESAVGLDASAPASDGKPFDPKTLNPDIIKLILQIIQIILALLNPTPVPVPTP